MTITQSEEEQEEDNDINVGSGEGSFFIMVTTFPLLKNHGICGDKFENWIRGYDFPLWLCQFNINFFIPWSNTYNLFPHKNHYKLTKCLHSFWAYGTSFPIIRYGLFLSSWFLPGFKSNYGSGSKEKWSMGLKENLHFLQNECMN